MATPNQITETENAAQAANPPVDPFAVDFFGGAPPLSDEDDIFEDKNIRHRRRVKAADKSDWYKTLPRISKREAEFSGVLSRLPQNLTSAAEEKLAETLARYTSQKNAVCDLVSVTEVNLKETLVNSNQAPKVYLTIGAGIGGSSAVAALSVDAASALIDSMLDEAGAPAGKRHELSPVETTILEFLAANILREINDFIGESLLFLEKIAPLREDVFEPFERGAELLFKFRSGKLDGFINIYLPQRFLKILEPASLFVRKSGRKSLNYFEKMARQIDLRLQIGTTFLDADSLLSLEDDDIVLIEQPQVVWQEDLFGGNLQIFAGRGSNFRFRGIAEDSGSNGSLNFKIEEILSEDVRRKIMPARFEMDEQANELTEKSGFEPDETAENTEGESPDEQISPSLENIQVALRVEIAGSKITLRELQNLRAGQIIGLGCAPTDPVRLVTDNNDEPVATGELVEIEGQLGVRLTKVFI